MKLGCLDFVRVPDESASSFPCPAPYSGMKRAYQRKCLDEPEIL